MNIKSILKLIIGIILIFIKMYTRRGYRNTRRGYLHEIRSHHEATQLEPPAEEFSPPTFIYAPKDTMVMNVHCDNNDVTKLTRKLAVLKAIVSETQSTLKEAEADNEYLKSEIKELINQNKLLLEENKKLKQKRKKKFFFF